MASAPIFDFSRDGFTVACGLWSAEFCTKCKTEIRRLVSEKADHGGVLVGLAAMSPFFAEAIREPRLLDLLETNLGLPLEFLSDKVAYKSADTDFGSPWHQDWPYWEGPHKVSVWIALDPATRENGCLKLIPGSHTALAAHDGAAAPGEAFGRRLSEGAVDESQAVTLECAVGDAVLFHDLTLHASHPNVAKTDRWAWIGTYRNATEPDLNYPWALARERLRG
jgi:ectoine hydroxylase-related dioxygenase (phytanoyl-CoA dioxygenase family)